jgi:hypothetical protein
MNMAVTNGDLVAMTRVFIHENGELERAERIPVSTEADLSNLHEIYNAHKHALRLDNPLDKSRMIVIMHINDKITIARIRMLLPLATAS